MYLTLLGYNQPFDFKNLTKLNMVSFGNSFNQSIDKLPNNVKVIMLSNIQYNQKINRLPSKLIKMNISNTYPYLNSLPKLFPNPNQVKSQITGSFLILTYSPTAHPKYHIT